MLKTRAIIDNILTQSARGVNLKMTAILRLLTPIL